MARRRALGAALALLAGLAAVPLQRRAGHGGGGDDHVSATAPTTAASPTPATTARAVWGANYGTAGHNCTSYVSYRLAQQGVAQPWRPMGNGNQWDDNGAKSARSTTCPLAGAVAQWEGGTRFAPGTSGHVAFVEAVTRHRHRDHRRQPQRRHPARPHRPRLAYWPSHFVHIHDTPAPPTPVLFQDRSRLNRRIGTQLHTHLRRLGWLVQDALAHLT